MIRTLSTILGVVCVVSAAFASVSILGVHFVAVNKSVLRDPVSDYGAGPHRAWYWGGLLGVATSGLCLIAAGWSSQRPAAIAFLAGFVAARIAIAFFPTDLADRPPTRGGTIHVVLAGIGFASLCGAAGFYSGVPAAVTNGLFATALSTAVCLGKPFRGVFGLVERLFYVAMLSWLILAGVGVLAKGA